MPKQTPSRKRRKPSRLWARTEYSPVSATVAAKHLPLMPGVNYLTALRMIERDEFPKPVRLSPGRVAWLRSDLEKWLEARKAATEVQS